MSSIENAGSSNKSAISGLHSWSLEILPFASWNSKAIIGGGLSKAVHLDAFNPTGISGPQWLPRIQL
ncbi:MAG: hypothetical protein ABSC20_01585 [Candidatus Bathyarchaeia archaeon]